MAQFFRGNSSMVVGGRLGISVALAVLLVLLALELHPSGESLRLSKQAQMFSTRLLDQSDLCRRCPAAAAANVTAPAGVGAPETCPPCPPVVPPTECPPAVAAVPCPTVPECPAAVPCPAVPGCPAAAPCPTVAATASAAAPGPEGAAAAAAASVASGPGGNIMAAAASSALLAANVSGERRNCGNSAPSTCWHSLLPIADPLPMLPCAPA